MINIPGILYFAHTYSNLCHLLITETILIPHYQAKPAHKLTEKAVDPYNIVSYF